MCACVWGGGGHGVGVLRFVCVWGGGGHGVGMLRYVWGGGGRVGKRRMNCGEMLLMLVGGLGCVRRGHG